MIGKKWVQFKCCAPQPLPLQTLRNGSDSLEGLGSYLDGDFWVSHQVAIPVRVGRCARVGGDHEQAVAIGNKHHRLRTELAALSACSREQKQWPALHCPTTFISIRAEFFYQLAGISVFGRDCTLLLRYNKQFV